MSLIPYGMMSRMLLTYGLGNSILFQSQVISHRPRIDVFEKDFADIKDISPEIKTKEVRPPKVEIE